MDTLREKRKRYMTLSEKDREGEIGKQLLLEIKVLTEQKKARQYPEGPTPIRG